MDWDPEEVTYSNQNPSVLNKESDINTIKSQLRQFIREFQRGGIEETFYYRTQLIKNYEQKIYKLEINFEDLNKYSIKLAENCRLLPSIYIPIFEDAAMEVVAMSKVPKPIKNDMKQIQIQLINLERIEIPIRDLDSKYISKLVRVPGIIVSSTKPQCKATSITLMCTNCRATIKQKTNSGFGGCQIPRTCSNASDEKNDRQCPLDPFTIIADKSEFIDIQKLKLQETPEDIPTGEMPRHITLFCERNLVNKVKPGFRINVIGIYRVHTNEFKSKKNDKYSNTVRKPYIQVIGFESFNDLQKKGKFTSTEEENIRELSRDPKIYEMIAKSIAPAIWGNLDIKKSIAALLFGGSRKYLSDGMKLRGDINVLLLGDPSVAKSQFLKFVDNVAPIAVYTSGKGSSASGLTASVLREPGSGEFHLEGGAMVLADGGVVCIDEFDKMRESDRVAIHEAMEQQTISIAKAGITTILNSRTSVLAAANPIFGRYDDMRSTNENIDFETTILSRFDLIFIIKDIKNIERDSKLAQHIMDLHINVNKKIGGKLNENNNAPISPDLLSKYINYAKYKIHPRLTKKSAQILSNHYVQFRNENKKISSDLGQQNVIPLTVRQLESLIRISEALAKIELKNEVNENHVMEAVRLFKVSTLKAAKQNELGTMNMMQNAEFMKDTQKAERNIKRRFVIGSNVAVNKIINEMKTRGLTEQITLNALNILARRGEIEFRNKRRSIYRKK